MPSNIMKKKSKPEDMTIVVGDFGSSRYFEDLDTWRTKTMSVQGTPCYMAPELREAVDKGFREIPFKDVVDVYSGTLCVLKLFAKNTSQSHPFTLSSDMN